MAGSFRRLSRRTEARGEELTRGLRGSGHLLHSEAAMHSKFSSLVLAGFISLMLFSALGQDSGAMREKVRADVRASWSGLRELYEHLHAHPELSYLEEKTAARIADELDKAGFDVTAKIGGHGVVGVLRNGDGPALLLRTDFDALPVREQTGLPF